MSRESLIAQQKQARREQMALDAQLRDWVQRLCESDGNAHAKLMLEASQAIPQLVKQGASVNIFVVRRDGQGKPVGMVSAASALLEKRSNASLAGWFYQKGARMDQDGLSALARALMHCESQTSLPAWSEHALSLALDTPGLNWGAHIEDIALSHGLTRLNLPVLAGKGRPIRIKKALNRIDPTFEGRWLEKQTLRGEACDCPVLPNFLTPRQATWLLYEIMSDGSGVEKLDQVEKLQAVGQLIAAGADPLDTPKRASADNKGKCALDLACRARDADLVATMLSSGAIPTARQVQEAVSGTLERNRQRFSSALGGMDGQEVLRVSKELFAVLAQMEAHGVVDLDSEVMWRTGLPGAGERHCRDTMRKAIATHLAPLLPMLTAWQQARHLEQATSEAPPAARRPGRL